MPGPLRTRSLLAALLLALSLAPVLAGETRAGQRLRVLTEGAYPPFNYLDENGKPAGFDVDVAQALCRAMDRDCGIAAVKWEELIPALTDGRGDVIVAMMGKTKDRLAVLDFTEPYQSSRSSFVARVGAFAEVDPTNVRGKRIACQGATIFENHLRKYFGAENEIVAVKTMEEAYDLLVAGKADLLLSDSLVNFEFLKGPRGQDFDFAGEPLLDDPESRNAYIAVRKGDAALLADLNAALAAIKHDGTYARINRKYFPFSAFK